MTVTEKMSRDRVDGFLTAKNGKMYNGRGEEILLCGMGVGNWLLPEGYMWRFGGRYNRPRTIEALVRDLCAVRLPIISGNASARSTLPSPTSARWRKTDSIPSVCRSTGA